MLGESFYKKADEIIEMHTREERSDRKSVV